VNIDGKESKPEDCWGKMHASPPADTEAPFSQPAEGTLESFK
jgi:hypothetical protein